MESPLRNIEHFSIARVVNGVKNKVVEEGSRAEGL